MIVLTSDRKQIGARLLRGRAPMLWDAGREAERAQIASAASNWWRDGIDAKPDCWGVVMVALMKCRTKTAASWIEATGRRGEGRR